MKKFVFAFLTILLAPASGFTHEDARIAIEPESISAQAGRILYKFQLLDTEARALLGDDALRISHEHKIHLLTYDPALKEFRHVHPRFDGEYWVTELDLSVNGNYWVWAQGVLASDGDEFSTETRLRISNGAPANPAPSLKDERSGTDGVSMAMLSNQRLRAGQMAMLDLSFGRNDGSQPDLSPYLGEIAHVVAVSQDGSRLVHVHPMAGSNPNKGMVHVNFPKAGMYRLWVQFMDGGTLRNVPLAVQVF